MTADPAAPAGLGLPRWLPWAFLGLLVLPFHPLWVDFEQVRRGLLLGLCGLSLLLLPRLPHVRGERAWLAFVACLLVCALVNQLAQWLAADPDSVRSFQPWEAAYRLAHWLALLVVLRLGASSPSAFATPLATLLVGTAAFGLLQRLGLAELAGYGVEREPVSVFGNLNVASEWTAVAAVATAVLGARPRWLAAAAVALAACYLVVNGSRSGLVALPVGLLLLAVLRRRERGWHPLALAAGGMALGGLLAAVLPRPEPVDHAASVAEQKRGTATLDVRFEIAKSSSKLFAENPLFGHGPGQFAVHYPRVRSQREIEASSHGRQFATEVRTAHDDWLELLVDGGLPALVLFAAALFALQRGCPDKARLLPLFVVLLLMLVRSPLGNAPAAAVAMLLAGTPMPAAPVRRAGLWRAVGVVAGLLGIALGLLPVVAHTLFAPYQAARARGEQPPVEAVAAAAGWMPFEPRWLQVLAQEELLAGDLAAASRYAARAIARRPYEPQLYLLLAEVLAKGTALDEAERLARHALRIDPEHPELRVLVSTVLVQRQQPDAAIEAVVHEPHPLLRAQLPEHFRSLARLAEQRGDPATAARMAVEHEFLRAVETLGDQSPAALTAAGEHVKQLLQAMRNADLLRKDLRWHMVAALHALDVNQPEFAVELGTRAQKVGVAVPTWQRDLFGDKLQPLLQQEVWFDVLRRR